MDITITETITTANIAGTATTVTLTYPGIQGAPGSDGIVTVNSPLTNTGTLSSAVLGIDQTLLSLTRTQIQGTAVTLNYGTALAAGTATYATTAGGAPPTGTAGGNLTGTYPNPTIAAGVIGTATIASTLYGVVGSIQALGTAAAGTSATIARADHVHPTTGLALLSSSNTFTGQTQMVKAPGIQGMSIETSRYPSLRFYNAAGASSTVLGTDPESGASAFYTSRALGSGEFYFATEIEENIPRWHLTPTQIKHNLPTIFTGSNTVTIETLAAGGAGVVHNNSNGVLFTSLIGTADIASTLYGVVGSIQALGSVAAGTSATIARADHVHPTTGLALLGSANTFTATQTMTGVTVSGFTSAGIVHNDASGVLSSSLIVNADISSSAAISTSKISGLATSATTDTTNAANITSGTLSNDRLSGVALLASSNTFTGTTQMVKASGVQGMSMETSRYPSLRFYNAAGSTSTVLGTDPESGAAVLYTSRALGSGEFFIATEIGENIPRWRVTTTQIQHSLPTVFQGNNTVVIDADNKAGFSINRFSATQSTNLLQLFQSNGSTVLASFGPQGNLAIRNDNGAAATVPLKVTAHATQSVDVFQLVTSAGANLAKVSSAGKLTTIIDGGSA